MKEFAFPAPLKSKRPSVSPCLVSTVSPVIQYIPRAEPSSPNRTEDAKQAASQLAPAEELDQPNHTGRQQIQNQPAQEETNWLIQKQYLTHTLKTSTLTHQSKQSGKPARKGAFKGALDPEPDDSETQQESHQPKPHHPHHPLHHREEEVWVSEPKIELEQLAIPLASIPKPQPSAPSTSQLVPFPAATSPLSPNPDQDLPPASDPEPETRGRSKSRHRNHDSEARSVRSEVSLTKPPPQPSRLFQPQQQPSSTAPNQSICNLALPQVGRGESTANLEQGQGKGVDELTQAAIGKAIINQLGTSTSSRRGLKRVDSAASVVLPPKIDTTEAVITMNGKATFNPTLMSILDFPTEPLPGQSESTPNTAICSPLATTSKIPFPSRRLLSDPNHYQPTCTADERSKAGHSSKALSGGLDESECARRLKNILDATKAGINLNGVRYPFAQSQKLLGHPPPRQPKPTLPGFITTCGPVPVLSKFLGPQPANLSPPTNTQQTRPGTSNPSPSSDRPSASPDPPSQQTTPKQHGFENGRSQHQHQPQLTRIQKKLLMERDRPISPTGLYDDPTPPTSAGPISGTSTTSALPPPSYLIRSLGGQTGPLPFIPLNLLPADPALPKSTSSTATTTHLSPSHTCTTNNTDFIHHHHHSIDNSPRLNQPALKAKQALSIKLWRNSLIDEVEQVLTDHESNTRFRNPLFESLIRVAEFNSNLASHHHHQHQKSFRTPFSNRRVLLSSDGQYDAFCMGLGVAL
ncbi:hypothetical protein KEM48_001919 [Puccinia striiformis f. sp. tritici PST-130]|nr:hypothetical protein KEM48_001919 [Puccinia striiformis f. sp. tritici PST-130]